MICLDRTGLGDLPIIDLYHKKQDCYSRLLQAAISTESFLHVHGAYSVPERCLFDRLSMPVESVDNVLITIPAHATRISDCIRSIQNGLIIANITERHLQVYFEDAKTEREITKVLENIPWIASTKPNVQPLDLGSLTLDPCLIKLYFGSCKKVAHFNPSNVSIVNMDGPLQKWIDSTLQYRKPYQEVWNAMSSAFQHPYACTLYSKSFKWSAHPVISCFIKSIQNQKVPVKFAHVILDEWDEKSVLVIQAGIPIATPFTFLPPRSDPLLISIFREWEDQFCVDADLWIGLDRVPRSKYITDHYRGTKQSSYAE